MKANTKRQQLHLRALRDLIPKAPYGDFSEIALAMRANHMCTLLPVNAAFLATVAHIRHQHTDYDALRDEGYDHDSARFFVADAIDEVLRDWGAPRGLDAEDAVDDQV
ncbi:MAG: DUF2293 domain-containing protein [Pseudomonadota bacterium]